MASERAFRALASLAFLSTAGLFAFAHEGITNEDLVAVGSLALASFILLAIVTPREDHTLRTA